MRAEFRYGSRSLYVRIKHEDKILITLVHALWDSSPYWIFNPSHRDGGTTPGFPVSQLVSAIEAFIGVLAADVWAREVEAQALAALDQVRGQVLGAGREHVTAEDVNHACTVYDVRYE